jgi:hypothetical protein
MDGLYSRERWTQIRVFGWSGSLGPFTGGPLYWMQTEQQQKHIDRTHIYSSFLPLVTRDNARARKKEAKRNEASTHTHSREHTWDFSHHYYKTVIRPNHDRVLFYFSLAIKRDDGIGKVK